MYRALAKSGADRTWLEGNCLRYDVTVIPACDLCGEPAKTKGHYHPKNRAGVGYPEVYEVLSGEAHFLLQSRDHTDAVVVLARKGELAVIPPDYGHITINPSSSETLVMANVVSTAFESDYAEYEAMQGAVYYETSAGTFEKNPRYGPLPPIRTIEAASLDLSGLCTCPLYRMVEKRESFDFLNRPEKYAARFRKLLTG
jgi:glucose-6-phosphate isomerase